MKVVKLLDFPRPILRTISNEEMYATSKMMAFLAPDEGSMKLNSDAAAVGRSRCSGRMSMDWL